MRKEYDFTGAKRARDVSHLSRLQAEMAGRKCTPPDGVTGRIFIKARVVTPAASFHGNTHRAHCFLSTCPTIPLSRLREREFALELLTINSPASPAPP